MAFVSAAITPHSPLLLPSVGKEYQSQTKKTRRALEQVAQELHSLRPDVVCIVHPHGESVERSFTLHSGDSLAVSFKDFGDLVTTASFRNDHTLTHVLREAAQRHNLPVALRTTDHLSYDAAVPLMCFGKQALEYPIVPLVTSTLDAQVHVNMGKLMNEAFHTTPQRVAVVMSAELSQHASETAATGFRPEGKTFDDTIMKLLGRKDLADRLLHLDPSVVRLAEACGYAPLLVLSGLVAGVNCHVRKLSYEHPFGIGFLTAVIHPA